MVIAGAVARVGSIVAAGSGANIPPADFLPDVADEKPEPSPEQKRAHADREKQLQAADQRALFAALSAATNQKN